MASDDFSRSHAPLSLGARLRISRCFRTTADGRVALGADWPRLFDELRACPLLSIQTRHTYARLVAIGPPPRFSALGPDTSPWLRDESGTLLVRCDTWQSAWGRVTPCPCCGSPGRIEVHNVHGLDFLHLSAMSDYATDDWAERIGHLLPGTETPTPSLPVAGEFPCLRDPRLCLPQSAAAVGHLLQQLAAEVLPIACTLRSAETTHTRLLLSSDCDIDATSGALSWRTDQTLLQLVLPAVQGVAVNTNVTACPLHLIGPGDSVLLSLAVAADAPATAYWRAWIQAMLPDLASLPPFPSS